MANFQPGEYRIRKKCSFATKKPSEFPTEFEPMTSSIPELGWVMGSSPVDYSDFNFIPRT